MKASLIKSGLRWISHSAACLALLTSPCYAQAGEPFPASGVNLMSHFQPYEFGPSTLMQGAKPWSYTSPSGREYAIFGGANGTAFIEVTDPGQPTLIGLIQGGTTAWRSSKVYAEHAYIVSEAGPAIQVIDLTQIDSGTISFVREVHAGGD